MNFLLLLPFPALSKRGGLDALFDNWRVSRYQPFYSDDDCDFDCDDENEFSDFDGGVSEREKCDFLEQQCIYEKHTGIWLLYAIFAAILLLTVSMAIIVFYMNSIPRQEFVRNAHSNKTA